MMYVCVNLGELFSEGFFSRWFIYGRCDTNISKFSFLSVYLFLASACRNITTPSVPQSTPLCRIYYYYYYEVIYDGLKMESTGVQQFGQWASRRKPAASVPRFALCSEERGTLTLTYLVLGYIFMYVCLFLCNLLLLFFQSLLKVMFELFLIKMCVSYI